MKKFEAIDLPMGTEHIYICGWVWMELLFVQRVVTHLVLPEAFTEVFFELAQIPAHFQKLEWESQFYTFFRETLVVRRPH